MSKFAKRYPTVARGLTDIVVFVFFGWIALYFVTDAIVQGNRDQCGRGNVFRVLELRELENLVLAEQREETASLAADELTKAKAAEERVEAYKDKQEGLIALAQSSGHAITEKGVTINCEAEYANPLSIG